MCRTRIQHKGAVYGHFNISEVMVNNLSELENVSMYYNDHSIEILIVDKLRHADKVDDNDYFHLTLAPLGEQVKNSVVIMLTTIN